VQTSLVRRNNSDLRLSRSPMVVRRAIRVIACFTCKIVVVHVRNRFRSLGRDRAFTYALSSPSWASHGTSRTPSRVIETRCLRTLRPIAQRAGEDGELKGARAGSDGDLPYRSRGHARRPL
jgi:hypothetical protein